MIASSEPDGNGVCLLTGAAAGIGASTARVLHARGVSLVLADIDSERLQTLTSSLGGRAVALVGDVGEQGTIERMIELAVDRFGRVDSAFLNAGVATQFTPLAEVDVEVFDSVMRANARSVFLGLKGILAHISQNGEKGVVVVNASTAGLRAARGAASYSSSKHAAVGLAKAAAMEAKSTGVRVNCICPGMVDTDMAARSALAFSPNDPDAFYATMNERTPLGRLAQPHEVAAVVAALLSPDFSYLNGAVIPVDGGLSA